MKLSMKEITCLSAIITGAILWIMAGLLAYQYQTTVPLEMRMSSPDYTAMYFVLVGAMPIFLGVIWLQKPRKIARE